MESCDGSQVNGVNPDAGKGRWRGLAYAAACFIAFAVLFHSPYGVMWQWWQGEDYNYCYFVPLIVLYLVWEKRWELRSIAAVPSWGGFVPLMAGIALYFLGELGGEFYCIYLGSWLVLIGCLWVSMGRRKLTAIAFPLAFMVAMFPLPNLINFNLTLRLKLISSKLAVAMMHLYGLTAYREGNVIDLGFTRLQVVDACSGLRYFFPLVVLAILLAYYFKGAFWKKMTLVLSAAPISVVTNSLRIASVGILYQFWGEKVAEGFFHDFSGWFIFMLSLGLLLLEMAVLTRVFPPVSGDEKHAATGTRPETALPVTGANAAAVPAKLRPIPVQFAGVVILLAVAVIWSQSIDSREKVPIARPFEQFPLRISSWQGVRVPMEKIYLDGLKFDDYVIVDFKDRQGKAVNFYTSYYSSQSKGEAIHSPASCLPGNGWVFEESGVIAIPNTAGGAMRVSRAYIKNGGTKELIYYWFPQHGRVLTDLFQLKLYTFWNALTERRTEGALVRVITPVYESEQLADAEARLQGFTREITPVLARFFPQ